jgi:hypothetical protein
LRSLTLRLVVVEIWGNKGVETGVWGFRKEKRPKRNLACLSQMIF